MTLKNMISVLAGVVGARFAGAALGLLTQVTLARLMSQEQVGIVFMAMSAAAFISLLVIGGHSLYVSTELPRFLAMKRSRLPQALHAAVLRDALVGYGLVTVVVAASFASLPSELGMAIVTGLICAPASGLLRYNSIIANSHRRFALASIPDFLVRPGLLLLAILCLWVWLKQLTAVMVLCAFAAIVIAVALWQAHRLGPAGLTFRHWGMNNAPYQNRLRGRALSLVIVSGVTLAFADIVMLFAGFLLPSADVAVVGVTVRLAALAGFVLQATQQFVLPDLTAAMTRQDSRSVDAIFWKTNAITLGLGLAAVVGSLFLGRSVLSIFGSEYVSGFWLLFVFLVGQCLRAAGGMNQQILAMNGYQLRTAGSCAAALVVFVAAAIVFTQIFGMNGLGLAVLATEIVWAGALAWQAGKLCDLRGDILALLLSSLTQKPVDNSR